MALRFAQFGTRFGTTLLVTLLLAPAASATQRARMLPQQLRVPPNATVLLEPCPFAPDLPGCAIPGGTTFAEPGMVYVNPTLTPRTSPLYPFVRWHEVGTFAQQWLDDGERNRITRLVVLAGYPWRGGTWGAPGNGQHSPEQRFEDAYALCQLGWYADESIGTPTPYGLALSHRQTRELCGTLRRALAD